MNDDLDQSNFPNEKAFQGYQRLLYAQAELEHGDWLGGRSLSPKQQEEGVFGFLLATDPIIMAYEYLPKEYQDSYPSLPPPSPVLAFQLAKMERVCRVFTKNPEIVIQALNQVW